MGSRIVLKPLLGYTRGVPSATELPWFPNQANGRVSALGSCYNTDSSSSSSKIFPSCNSPHSPELRAILSTSGPSKPSSIGVTYFVSLQLIFLCIPVASASLFRLRYFLLQLPPFQPSPTSMLACFASDLLILTSEKKADLTCPCPTDGQLVVPIALGTDSRPSCMTHKIALL